MYDFCCQIEEDKEFEASTSPSPTVPVLETFERLTVKPPSVNRKFLHLTLNKQPAGQQCAQQSSPRPTTDTLIQSFRSSVEEKRSLNMLCKQLSTSKQEQSGAPNLGLSLRKVESPTARLATSPIQRLRGLISIETKSVIMLSESNEEQLKVRVQKLCRKLPLTIGQH